LALAKVAESITVQLYERGIAMKAFDRNAFAVLCGAIVVLPLSGSASAADAPLISKADNYPHKPIRVIDPFAAAGASDIVIRLVGQKLTERYGQPVIVDNRPGAGGNLAAELAAKATPDGYTLFNVVVFSLAPSVSLYPKMSVDPMKDFAYISLMAGGSYVIVAHPSFPAKTIPELVNLAKQQPGKISYGSSGVGGPVHIAGELLKSRAGINLLHVPYKGAAPIMTAVAGNEVPIGFPSVAGAMSMLKAGRVVPIAVTSAQRAKSLPDVPTIAESGYPGYDITPWYGIAAPAQTPDGVVKGLSAEITRILAAPEARAALTVQGLDATGSTPERMRNIMRDTIAITSKIIKDVGIKLD
jgi:tripartite-type tricarboxylate transporter receptor subunit TctC